MERFYLPLGAVKVMIVSTGLFFFVVFVIEFFRGIYLDFRRIQDEKEEEV